MIPQRVLNPIIPGNRKDRTGTAGILRRAGAAIRKRWAGLQVDVLAIFDRIPIYGTNDVAVPAARTIYGLTPDELAATAQALQDALDRWISAGRETKHVLWWEPYPEEAMQLGTAQSVANLTQLSPTYAAARSLQSVVFSQPYRNRVAMAQIKSYEHWTGISAGMRSELSQIIGRAVVDGKAPRAVRAEIMERLDVGRSRALQYAQTDITDTLRQARMDEADHASATMGMDIGLLWTSALIPTTRPWHASRNGQVYSSAEVREFYGKNGNIYRCFLPGTMVSGRFVAGVKSHYKGPAVRLVTAAGRELSVTANHPVLTARGMVPAAEICKGDKLIAYGTQAHGSFGIGDLDRGLMGARVEDVFGALVQAGHKFPARVSAVDLHGDAAFVDPDVDVVRSERELVFALDPAAAQLLDEIALVLSDTPATRGGPLDLLGETEITRAGSGIGAGSQSLSLSGGELCQPNALPIAAPSPFQAESGERIGDGASLDARAAADRNQRLASEVVSMQWGATLDGLAPRPLIEAKSSPVKGGHHCPIAGADAVGDVLQRFSGLASFDEVVSSLVFQHEGHVFDLQERSGLMLGSNIVASNCHCATTECLLDDAGAPILTRGAKDSMRNELEAWKKANDAPP